MNVQGLRLWLIIGAILVAGAAWAAEQGDDEKKVYTGPGKWTFGRLDLALEAGGSSEVQYQPDTSRLVLTTLTGEVRVITSARYLVFVENTEGTVEIQLASGRVIQVEPGRSEIVGRALVDDPGQIIIRLASTGAITVLEGVPAARLLGIVTPFGGEFHGDSPVRPANPRAREGEPASPTQLSEFGRRF